jgi:hypothetical protein
MIFHNGGWERGLLEEKEEDRKTIYVHDTDAYAQQPKPPRRNQIIAKERAKTSANSLPRLASAVVSAPDSTSQRPKRRLMMMMSSRQNGLRRECVLFIGTRFSNLYTAVKTPARAA